MTWSSITNGYIGERTDGSVAVEGTSELFSNHGYLGYKPGSRGEATVAGAGALWINYQELFVGREGVGILSIQDGGAVRSGTSYLGFSLGSSGEATVAGSGAEWDTIDLHVGGESGGILNVQTGGMVNSNYGYLGYSGTSAGKATISGTDSHWTINRWLHVGFMGHGKLSIEAGGRVENVFGFVGDTYGSKGEVTVEGNNSRWSNYGNLTVGNYSEGVLHIRSGGEVANRSGILGAFASSSGEATVTGAASRWANSSNLVVGRFGSGELTISNGGLVSVAGTLTVGQYSPNDSFISLSTGGMLALASNPSGDDSLADFLALVGGTKAIRYWDDALADWADITAATYGDDYTLEYLTSGDLAGYTLLTVGQLPALAGDYNDDGVVDAADYSVWRDHLGQSVTLPNQATPGAVTEYDRDLWAANYGATLQGSAIPEPNALVLAALAAVGLAARRRS